MKNIALDNTLTPENGLYDCKVSYVENTSSKLYVDTGIIPTTLMEYDFEYCILPF